jgi:hypothetical protein
MSRHKVKRIQLQIPTWSRYLYVILALILLPWTIYLGLTLPEHHLSAHWDASWVGLDIALIVSLSLTGLFALFRSPWIIMSASSAASFLLVDAWFDIMSEKGGLELVQSLTLSLLVELPLAAMSYYLAYHVAHARHLHLC